MPASVNASNAEIEPGQFVRNPRQPTWGLGQVQSAIGARVTVNFEHAGKMLVNTAVVELELVDVPRAAPAAAR